MRTQVIEHSGTYNVLAMAVGLLGMVEVVSENAGTLGLSECTWPQTCHAVFLARLEAGDMVSLKLGDGSSCEHAELFVTLEELEETTCDD